MFKIISGFLLIFSSLSCFGQSALELISFPACNGIDGKVEFQFDESQFEQGWFYPFDLEILNEQTGDIEYLIIPNNNINLVLLPAEYRATIDFSDNCTLTTDFVIINIPVIELHQNEDLKVVDHCRNINANGSISFVNPFGSGYSYSWSGPNGFSSTSQDLENLKSGEYCVEVTELGNTQCIYAKGCVQVDMVFPPNVTLASKENLEFCSSMGENNCDGSLSLNVPSDVTIKWLNIPNASQQFSSTITDLCKGTYKVETCTLEGCCRINSFTIDCCVIFDENEEVTIFPNLQLTGDIDMATSATSSDGSLTLSISPYNNPLIVSWSGPNGYTEYGKLNLKDLKPGEYCVTVNDGCNIYNECFNVYSCDSDFINIEVLEEPCEGSPTGQIQVVFGPGYSEDDAIISFDGNIYAASVDSNDGLMIAIGGLSGGQEYLIEIELQGCSQNKSVNLDESGVVTEFSHYDESEDLCFADLLCNGEIIGDNAISYPSEINYWNASGGLFSSCEAPIFCGSGNEVGVKSFEKRKVTKFEYFKILQALAYSGISGLSETAQSRLNFFYQSGWNLEPCSKIKYCEANLAVVWTGWDLASEEYVDEIPPGSNCWKVFCNNLVDDKEFCLDESLAPYNLSPENQIWKDCDIRTINAYQLIVWHEQLKDQGNDYFGTDIYDLLEFEFPSFDEMVEELNSLDGDSYYSSPLLCANVTFCLNDFSIISLNIPECGYCPNLTAYNPDCPNCYYSDYLVYTSTLECNCQTYNLGSIKCGQTNVLISNELDLFSIGGDDTGEDWVKKITTNEKGSTEFKKFGMLIDNNCVLPKGIYTDLAKTYIEDYSSTYYKQILFESPNIENININFDHDSQVYVEKSRDNYYLIHTEIKTATYVNKVFSEKPFEIINLKTTEAGMTVTIKCKSDLKFGEEVIRTSDNASIVIIKSSYIGEIFSVDVIDTFSEDSEIITKKGNPYELGVFRTLTDQLSINESSIVSNSGDIFILKNNLDERIILENSFLNLGENVKIQDWVIENNGLMHFLLSGKGYVTYQERRYEITSDDKLGLFTLDSSKSLIAFQTIDAKSLSNVKLALLDSELIVSGSFNGDLSYDDLKIHSKGGTDLFFGKFRENRLYSYVTYGSEHDETVKEVLSSCGRLYFGGTFYNSESVKIGKYEFVSPSKNASNAYISYIDHEDFIETEVSSTFPIENRSTNINSTDFIVFPNPFSNSVTLEYKSLSDQLIWLRIYDTLGTLIFEKSESSIIGVNKKIIDLSDYCSSSGVYILSLTKENQVFTEKLIRN